MPVKDSDSQYKSLVLGLNGGIWIFRKSQKISTASDQYFLSYVKKTTGPPSRNRVKITKQKRLRTFFFHILHKRTVSVISEDLPYQKGNERFITGLFKHFTVQDARTTENSVFIQREYFQRKTINTYFYSFFKIMRMILKMKNGRIIKNNKIKSSNIPK